MNDDKKLRSDLIRLAASSTPEVKAAILPLLKLKTAASRVPVIVDETSRDISTILVDTDDARAALQGVAAPDRLNALFPIFGRSMSAPVKLLPKELIALGKAGLLKTAPKVDPQRAYDRLLDEAAKEVRNGARDYEEDVGSDPDWFELADAVFSGRAREFAPLMKELGLRRSDVVLAIAEAAAG